MKICVYKDSLRVGRGADRAVRAFAAALAARGHDVGLVEREGLARALAAHWDVFVATGSNEAVDLDRAGYFEKPGRARVVLQLHLAPRGFFKWRHPLRNRAIRRAFRKADAAQVLCRDYADELRRFAPGLPVGIIGNFTTIAAPDDVPEGRPPVILYPAAVVNRVKNQRLLIRAFARLAEDFPVWRVRLLGRTDTPHAASCRRLAERLGVADRIEFAGFTGDLAGEYSRAAFVAFPSTLEGFPLAILEAAAFARPAVAQRTLPGVRDIVVDGETGFVTAEDPAAYAEGLARLMADASLRRSLGGNARRHCAEVYSENRILDDWERFLKETERRKDGK